MCIVELLVINNIYDKTSAVRFQINHVIHVYWINWLRNKLIPNNNILIVDHSLYMCITLRDVYKQRFFLSFLMYKFNTRRHDNYGMFRG